MRPPFSFLTSRLYSSKGSLGCVQRLNIYVKPTRQISSWQKPLANKTKKWKISWKWRLHSQRSKNNIYIYPQTCFPINTKRHGLLEVFFSIGLEIWPSWWLVPVRFKYKPSYNSCDLYIIQFWSVLNAAFQFECLA